MARKKIVTSTQPIRIRSFIVIFTVIPATIAGFLILNFYSLAQSNPQGLANALSTIVIAGILMQAATWLIIIFGAVGLIYTFKKARFNWRYYVAALILPFLVASYFGINTIARQIELSQPERVRYEQYAEQCFDLSKTTFLSTDPLDTSYYLDEAVEPYQADIVQLREDYKEIGPLSGMFDPGAPCDDKNMSEAELEQLQNIQDAYDAFVAHRSEVFGKISTADRLIHLKEFATIEATGDLDGALAYARKNIPEGVVKPSKVCDDNDNCVIKWVKGFYRTEMTTQEYINSEFFTE